MGKRKGRATAVQAREDRRAFLAFLTALLNSVGGLFTLTGAGLNFFTARREQATAKRHYALKAETGHFRVITGTANLRAGPASLSAVGTVRLV